MSSNGASLLPVIAIYSMYELEMEETSRFSNKFLCNLSSHTSADIHTNNAGDIDIIDENGDLYEVVEVKFDIPIDCIMVRDCYDKIKPTKIQRYYILSTNGIVEKDKYKIINLINKVKLEHGCQIIINGVFPTIKYYLRLLSDSDEFMENYLENLKNNPEVKYEHKISWNTIVNKEK